MKTFKVGLVGITGYTGMELARLLATHPRMKLEMACSRTESGLRLGEFYPFLEGLPGSDVVISIFDAKEAARRCDLVFLAVPHGKAMEMAGELLEAGTRVIDLSADFRLRDVNVYEDWYVPHTRRELLPEAVYGLPELYAAETARARLVANPGCYPSSAILGLYAAFKHNLISPDNIVIDSKSGTSGAGRKPVVPSLFCEVYDTFRAYGLGKHRHTGELLEAGTRVIDLSADFRLRDVNVYEDWYVPHTRRELLPEAVYGLPELYAAETARARLVANPGCYPSSAILGLYAAFKHNLISPDNIVIDSKSGTSGAGRKPVVPSLFCEVYDTFRAYGLGKHRHTPEIEQEFSRAAGCDVRVSFNPHLVPMVRGILSTIYTTLRKPGITLDEVHAAYRETWAQSPWVRVLPKGKLPETRFVRGSMFCDLGLVVDPRTNRLIVVSAIDNLCRGASGQALANANLMCGLPVDCGLNAAPMLP